MQHATTMRYSIYARRACEFQKLHCYPDFPSAPLSPEFLPQSLTSAVLSWSPPTNFLCVTSYTINLTKFTEGDVSYVYNTTTNTTNMTVSDLNQGAKYSFTVAGVDTGGRVGEKSMAAKFLTLDSEFMIHTHIHTYLHFTYVYTDT